jgi:hypothetical protein
LAVDEHGECEDLVTSADERNECLEMRTGGGSDHREDVDGGSDHREDADGGSDHREDADGGSDDLAVSESVASRLGGMVGGDELLHCWGRTDDPQTPSERAGVSIARTGSRAWLEIEWESQIIGYERRETDLQAYSRSSIRFDLTSSWQVLMTFSTFIGRVGTERHFGFY